MKRGSVRFQDLVDLLNLLEGVQVACLHHTPGCREFLYHLLNVDADLVDMV